MNRQYCRNRELLQGGTMFRRPLYLGLFLLLPLLIVLSCSDDDETTAPDDNGDGEPYGTISGVIETTFGQGLPGVTVTAQGMPTETNEDGWFYLSDVPVGSALVAMARDGYLTTYRTTPVLQNQTTHIGTIVLIMTETSTLDAAMGGEVVTSDSDGSVKFEAASIVSEDGEDYTGEMSVEITAMLPTDDGFFNSFPGVFEGIREDGTSIQFESYGFMGVNMYSTTGAKLQLGNDKEAEMELRIPDQMADSAPDTMPMWYFDETDGVWKEEGFAVRDGSQYRTSVSHMTIWNWDYPIEDVCTIEGRVVNNDGEPVSDARVISQGMDVTYRDEDFTDATGAFSVRALKNSTVSIWAIKGSYASEAATVEVGEECPVELEDPLVLREPAFSIALRWGLDPSDLDADFFIPMTWDENWDLYHIAYYNLGTLAEDPYTALDTDDVTSYGPEIISGFNLYEGTYSYFVHLFSGSGTIADSPALVNLEIAGQARAYNASTASGTVGEYWHVFDFVVGSNGGVTITDVNRFETWDFGDARIYEGFGRALQDREELPRK
jgi:hypothetical protein